MKLSIDKNACVSGLIIWRGKIKKVPTKEDLSLYKNITIRLVSKSYYFYYIRTTISF